MLVYSGGLFRGSNDASSKVGVGIYNLPFEQIQQRGTNRLVKYYVTNNSTIRTWSRKIRTSWCVRCSNLHTTWHKTHTEKNPLNEIPQRQWDNLQRYHYKCINHREQPNDLHKISKGNIHWKKIGWFSMDKT